MNAARMLPPVDWMRAAGGIFAKQAYNFAFTNGALTQYKPTAGNEAIGFVGLPITVAKSIVATLLDLINARKDMALANSASLESPNGRAAQAKGARGPSPSPTPSSAPSFPPSPPPPPSPSGRDPSGDGGG